MAATEPDRCRVVLIAPAAMSAERFASRLRLAAEGGDVASLLVPRHGMDDASFQHFCEHVVPVAQSLGIATVVADDSRVAGRVGADGIHMEGSLNDIADDIPRLQTRMMVGVGGIKTRDDALDLGELRPDYVFFGKFGFDTKPEAHPRNLSLGEWWAEVIEIPCIVMAGSEIASVADVAATRAEFVALSSAVFGEGIDPRAAIAEANALLDAKAPRFEEPR